MPDTVLSADNRCVSYPEIHVLYILEKRPYVYECFVCMYVPTVP